MQQPLNMSPTPKKNFALFALGFRPFFFFSSLFSVIATLIWMASYGLGWSLPVSNVTPIAWHGHEMIFGYAVGITAGFLLTAVRNWTGVATINGLPLILLAAVWALARILPLLNSPILFVWAAVFDILFLIGFILAVLHPIVKAKQWRQLAIVTKLVLILAANILYYLGAFQVIDQGVSWGLYSAVYLEIAIIFTLARRVMPFFIERGVPYEVHLKNWQFIDSCSLLFLAAFWISDVFLKVDILTALLAVVLTVIHSIRLWGWHTHGIWKTPLLWVLYVGYSMFVLGFALKAINYFALFSNTIPLHAFTYGGIGMVTMGMVSRVSLGHTGRNIMQPPKVVLWVFLSLLVGAIIRVIAPIVVPSLYLEWIMVSQILWIAAFSLFLFAYAHILIQPRTDGQPG
jgi:uncharacterized protein involved in response to NO